MEAYSIVGKDKYMQYLILILLSGNLAFGYVLYSWKVKVVSETPFAVGKYAYRCDKMGELAD